MKKVAKLCLHGVVSLEVENSVKTCGAPFLNNMVLSPQCNQIDVIVLRR